MNIKTIGYSATAPGSSGAAGAALTGDSLTIENNTNPTGPRIIDAWGVQQTSGFQQLAFPSGHDTTRGYRVGIEAADSSHHLAEGLPMPVTSQELISITIAGSATAGDVELGFITLLYPNLPGIEARLMTWDRLRDRAEKFTTLFATIAGAAAGWTGTELINAESDLLLANRDYAVLGMTTTVDVGAIAIVGPDTGNVRIGVPGSDQLGLTYVDYFPRLARAHDRALIPIVNSGNRNSTSIVIAQDENNVNAIVTVYLALLERGT